MGSAELQLLRIGIGLLVSYLLTTITMLGSTGDFATALLIFPSILAASVICTMGIGLIIWVPLFWLVGFITLAIVGAMGLVRLRTQPTPPMQRDIRAIVGYIRNSRSQGASDTQISVRLREKGWTEDEINEAFQTFN